MTSIADASIIIQTPIDTKLYQEAEEQIQRQEAEVNSLRKDLEKLQKQSI